MIDAGAAVLAVAIGAVCDPPERDGDFAELGEIALLAEGLKLVRERIEGSTKLDEALAPLLNEMRSVTKRLQYAVSERMFMKMSFEPRCTARSRSKSCRPYSRRILRA